MNREGINAYCGGQYAFFKQTQMVSHMFVVPDPHFRKFVEKIGFPVVFVGKGGVEHGKQRVIVLGTEFSDFHNFLLSSLR